MGSFDQCDLNNIIPTIQFRDNRNLHILQRFFIPRGGGGKTGEKCQNEWTTVSCWNVGGFITVPRVQCWIIFRILWQHQYCYIVSAIIRSHRLCAYYNVILRLQLWVTNNDSNSIFRVFVNSVLHIASIAIRTDTSFIGRDGIALCCIFVLVQYDITWRRSPISLSQ